ncbi:hypothetical protein CHARACLAT_030255, partial [Characodon lateralis]|nr:hypothetical protein [Characodon lateralis]
MSTTGFGDHTADLTATSMGSSIVNRCGEHGPLRLYVSNLPRNLVKALLEVGVEYIPGRELHQTFPADPHYTLGLAKSVQLSPLPANPTHHQVVIIEELSSSLHPSVQNMQSEDTTTKSIINLLPRLSWCQ